MIITLSDCLVPACEGGDHKWEFERPTIRELKRIETATGMDVETFFQGLGDVETTGVTSKALDAILALVDVLHRRDGLRVPFEDIDVDFPSFGIEFQPGETDDDEPEDEEGKGPAQAETSRPPAAEVPGSGSGPAPAEESTPSSSPTPPDSGGGSDSP